MQKILVGIFILLALGCKNIETQKVSSESIVQKELQQIDWNEVEDYPTFPACENCTDKLAQKKCFEAKLTTYLYSSLAHHKVILKDSIKEKIWLHLSISPEGKPSLSAVKLPLNVQHNLPELTQWLDSAVLNLPTIYPARKRGIPVATSFKLPLVIKSE